MLVDLVRLEGLLLEAQRCAETQVSYNDRIEFAAAREQGIRRAGEDAAWIAELIAEYRQGAEAAAAELAQLEREIRDETLRQERIAGSSIRAQLELARFLDHHGRDGTDVACRSVLLSPFSGDEALALASYLREKGQLPEAIDAARQGWQRFGGRVLRSLWIDLLDQAGAVDELVHLLRYELRAAPDDLSLMERLAALLAGARRTPEAYEIMVQALAHPAGATRLLATFMQALAAAGDDALALRLAAEYLRKDLADKMLLRREIAETLRRAHYLPLAVAFLDAQAAELTAEQEIPAYRTAFLINSLRNDDPAVRREALALLAVRRDPDVENQLATMYSGARGEELRLLLLQSLVHIQGAESLPFLQRALAADAPRVRMAAARTIARSCSGPASREVLISRLGVEADEGVRVVLAEALHEVDPARRTTWDRLTGRRPWADAQPELPPLPEPNRLRVRLRALGLSLLLVVLVGLWFAPIEPSPREQVTRLYGQAAGMLATRQAEANATATPVPTPAPTATRTGNTADMASGQVVDALAGDIVRVQLSNQVAMVRYIGVDVPSAGQPGARAVLEANRSMVAARLVYLEQGAIHEDSSGRWLRYVWLPEGQMANERLLELGFGVPAVDPQDTKYQQRLADAATKAWQARSGFWAGGTDVYPMAAVRSAEANIRETPGTDQPVKLQVKQGAVFAVLGRNVTSDWIVVRAPGFSAGWMSTSVVDLTVKVATLPVAK